MTTPAQRRFALAAVAIGSYAACATTTPAEPQHTPFSDGPKHNVPRSQETASDYAIDPPRPPRARAARSNSGGRSTQTPRAPECTLDDIKRRESGGDYGAVSSSGKYRGAYQFDRQTWASVGGNGDPAAASPEEQDARAAELMRQRGTQPWSVCR